MELLQKQYLECTAMYKQLCSSDGLFVYFTKRFKEELKAPYLFQETKEELFDFVKGIVEKLDKDMLYLREVSKALKVRLLNLLEVEIEDNLQEIMCPLLTKITGVEYKPTEMVWVEDGDNVTATWCSGIKNDKYEHKIGEITLDTFKKRLWYFSQENAIIKGDLIYFEKVSGVLYNAVYLLQDSNLGIDTLYSMSDRFEFFNPVLDEHKVEIDDALTKIYWGDNADSKKGLIEIYYKTVKEFADKYQLGENRDAAFEHLLKPFFEDEEEEEQI